MRKPSEEQVDYMCMLLNKSHGRNKQEDLALQGFFDKWCPGGSPEEAIELELLPLYKEWERQEDAKRTAEKRKEKEAFVDGIVERGEKLPAGKYSERELSGVAAGRLTPEGEKQLLDHSPHAQIEKARKLVTGLRRFAVVAAVTAGGIFAVKAVRDMGNAIKGLQETGEQRRQLQEHLAKPENKGAFPKDEDKGKDGDNKKGQQQQR